MSLKTRLRISIVTLMMLFVFAECVLSLRITAEANFRDAIERVQAIDDQVRHMVTQRLNEEAAKRPNSAAENPRVLWRRLAEEDAALPLLLRKTLASALAVLEVLVCDETGVILASSNLDEQRRVYPPLPDFGAWTQRPIWERLLEVLTQNQEYARIVPLGMVGQEPVLTIRVIVSTVLIRRQIMPLVEQLVWVSALFMLAPVVLAYLFPNVILRSLDRLSQRIESIATGKFPDPAAAKLDREVKEFADMQSKLDVLSQQFRGARDDVVQLRANIEHMLERLEEAVLVFDGDLRLQRASRTAEQLLDMPRVEMEARTLEGLFPPYTALGATIQRALATGQPVRDVTLTLDRDAASPVRVLVNVEPLEGGLLVTLRDAETRRQIRSQLDISTRLAAISRLTGGVAHEIKNPLNAMALHLEVLRSKVERGDDVEHEMSVIGGEIARLDRVVKTFLDFTRPVDLELADLDLSALVRQIADLVQPEAARSGVTIALSLDQPVLIRGDEDLLKQAILNVVNNGIEAMPKGGKLEVTLFREFGEAVLRVTDHGLGIPDSVRDKIFNLYFTSKPRGSGIGLAVTFRIVQLHSASIDFQTEPGSGTTFRMRFPDAGSSASAPAAAVGVLTA